MADSLCNPPSLSLPSPPDLLAILEEALKALGIQIPPLPSIPLPSPPCALD